MTCKNNEAPYYTAFIQFSVASKLLPQHPFLARLSAGVLPGMRPIFLPMLMSPIIRALRCGG